MQVLFDAIVALAAFYGAITGTISLIQQRKQTQRKLSVSLKQDTLSLGRIPDGQGGSKLTLVNVLLVHMVNAGFIPVMIQEAGLIGPDGTILTCDLYAERRPRNKQIPLELAPGDDFAVHIDIYKVLQLLKRKSLNGNVTVQGYVKTPLKQYKSKKMYLNMKPLSATVMNDEGSWRKDPLM